MSASTVLIVAALVALLAAMTGILPKPDGSVGAVLTSPRIRWGMAACSILLVSIGLFMWSQETKREGWAQCTDCPQEIHKLHKDIEDLNGQIGVLKEDIRLTQRNVNESADRLYDESAQQLVRVATLIGKKTRIGCEQPYRLTSGAPTSEA